MQNFLPSKKMQMIIGSVIFTGIIIYGGYFLATHNFLIDKKETSEDEALIQKRVNETTLSLQKDSDNDNLKDWEETLWGTNPNNPDTDGDGIKDGEEIKANHNPLNSSSDALIKTNEDKEYSSTSTTEKTPTDKLTTDLLSQYLYLRSNKETLNQEEKDGLVQNIASSNEVNVNLTFTTYSLNDLKVIPGEMTSEQQVKYLQDVVNTLNNNETNVTENELVIFQKALDENNKNLLKKLDPSINFYLKSAKALLLVSVPTKLAQKHLNLINSFTHLGESISYLKQGFDEPLLILTDLKKYSVYSVDMANALQAVFSK